MKVKNLKQRLLAFACAFAMMSTGLPVTAAEAAEPEAASLMSLQFTASCGCKIGTSDYETVSLRSCVSNGGGPNGTHTSEYYITYICPNGHGWQSKTEFIKETHVPSRSWTDEGYHDKFGDHVYSYRCTRCGDIASTFSIPCMAPADAKYGHAVP